jgi:chaperonin GroES
MDLAKLKSVKKTFPFDNASNVIFPMITTAAIQFHARAYPNIVQPNGVVKAKVVGDDPQGMKAARAMRISEFMTWQLLEEDPDWEEELDKALLVLPIVGCFFKKTYYSTLYGRNVSKVVYAQDLIVNQKTKSLDTASRISELIEFRHNEYIEQVRSGNFLHVPLGPPTDESEDNNNSSEDTDAPHVFIEQHCWLDLDGDDYKEPYVVTVDKATGKVLSIKANYDEDSISRNDGNEIQRIESNQYYTKFNFIPAPDGSFYDWGFGALLSPINKTINTTINQLLDAGTLHNTGGGFIGQGLALHGKTNKKISFRVGEWKPIKATGDDIRKSIVPLPTKEPSLVLFQLLGMMVDMGDKLSSVADVMSGEMPGQNVPATTTLALIEQGMKVFTAIYKRIFRSLKKEFKKLYELNRLYLEQPEYTEVLDNEAATTQLDFGEDFDVVPVGDPNEVSDMQKIFKSQALMQFRGMGLNDQVIMQRALEALAVPDIPELTQNVPEPPTPPEVVLDAQKFEMEGRKLALEERKINIEEQKLPLELKKLDSESIKNIADAESKNPGDQYQDEGGQGQYDDIVTALAQRVQELTDIIIQGGLPTSGLDQGAVTGMEEQPLDQGGLPVAEAGPGPDAGIISPGNEPGLGLPV